MTAIIANISTALNNIRDGAPRSLAPSFPSSFSLHLFIILLASVCPPSVFFVRSVLNGGADGVGGRQTMELDWHVRM